MMKKVLTRLTKKLLSGGDIVAATEGETRVVTYSELQHMKDLDELFKDSDSVALLYEVSPGLGHWVALTRNKGGIEFMDPYGNSPDSVLLKINPKWAAKCGQDYPHLLQLIYDSGEPFIWNPVHFQKKRDDMNTCGRHVLLRCVLAHVPLREYVEFIGGNGVDSDQLVTLMTAFV